MAAEAMQRWTCVEAGCDYAAEAATAEDLVPAVMDHIREAHDSFELEEMILAVVEDTGRSAPADGLVPVGDVHVGPDWAGRHSPAITEHRRRSMEWDPGRGLADT